MDESEQKEVKTQKSASPGAPRPDESRTSTNRSTAQQEVIKDSRSIALRATSSTDGDKGSLKKKDDSAEFSVQRVSRAETVRQDARKLKTATLNRMGKMFRQRSQTPVADKSFVDVDNDIVNVLTIHFLHRRYPTKSVENCTEEASRKEKSNSLGRMLKLVDKDGSPKKLFHPRAGSLSRILRRHPRNEDNEAKKPAAENAPGIFSRMLNQIRGNGNATLEPNIKARNKITSLPPKIPLNSRTVNSSSSTSASSTPQMQIGGSQKSSFEYSI
ncbi:unnamed protein product [Xylocopa violacea]|uniref:Uncharacterized protein n=1 Tax=Xylocopa violacea TaxID=135666 RepID=A0ABP1PJB4_XYLVO